MQWAQYVHAIVGVLLIAVIIAHIYTGTMGVEGSSTAMVTGEVDTGWARTHHSAWLERQEARRAAPRGTIEPAE
jgi:formate dehydrogenase subunit gamma